MCEFLNENRLAGQVITPESPGMAPMRARYLAEGNESPRPRIDLDGVRKLLATALDHDDPLAECSECDRHDQKAHDAYMAKRQKPLYGGGLSPHNISVPKITPLPCHRITACCMMSLRMKETPRASNRYLMSAIPFQLPRRCRPCGENN